MLPTEVSVFTEREKGKFSNASGTDSNHIGEKVSKGLRKTAPVGSSSIVAKLLR